MESQLVNLRDLPSCISVHLSSLVECLGIDLVYEPDLGCGEGNRHRESITMMWMVYIA